MRLQPRGRPTLLRTPQRPLDGRSHRRTLHEGASQHAFVGKFDSMALLEAVFRRQGIPTYTYVEPSRFREIRLSIRSAGRCVVIEGPSGIGKSTVVDHALRDLGRSGKALVLSARKPEDIPLIEEVLSPGKVGTVIIDDFHRLSDALKQQLSDKMKVIADQGDDATDKVIAVGINKAGDRLLTFSPDIATRIDVFRLESNPDDKIAEVIEKGEQVLNIRIESKADIIERAQGSFQIAQVLCYALCAKEGVEETVAGETRRLVTSIDVIVERVMEDLDRQFGAACLAFARGSKLRREGRAPYLHILKWLAETNEWSLDLSEELRRNPTHRGSIGQVIEKGFLERLMEDPDKKALLEAHFHYDSTSTVLSVEDPKLVFYLRNLVWRAFTRRVGYSTDFFDRTYDFALSFAGAQRDIAQQLRDELVDREISVFYDKDEQHRILAKDVEEYLIPIYRSEALFVVPILSPEYPQRIWAKIESDAFRARFGEGAVIPVVLSSVVEGFFNEYMRYGYVGVDVKRDISQQVAGIAELLARKIKEERAKAAAEETA